MKSKLHGKGKPSPDVGLKVNGLRKLNAEKKAKMTDFDRFKLMRAKQSRNKIIRLTVGKLRKKPLKDVLPRTEPPKPRFVYKKASKSKKEAMAKKADAKKAEAKKAAGAKKVAAK